MKVGNNVSHIAVLLLTFLWKFCPELIKAGYVYAATPPLYKVVKGKESEYLINDAALDEYRRVTKGKFEVSRFKGLGEMDAEQLAETTMDPNTRILKQITVDDMDEMTFVIEQLMGTSPERRKAFIAENAHRANISI